MEGFRIINPTVLENAQALVADGKFGMIESADFEILPYPIQPIDGYTKPLNFPQCCPFHKKASEYAIEAQNNFPNCCDEHKKLNTAQWFQKEHYKYIPDKTLATLSYAEHAISTLIEGEDWYNDITSYLEHCYESFGQLPFGYGNPLGIGIFHTNIIHWLEGRSNLDSIKKDKLLLYFKHRFDTKADSNTPDPNSLVDTYRRWLAMFPFPISFFREMKGRFEQAMPPLLKETTSYNKYSKKKKAKMLSVQELTSILTGLTKQLLKEINTQELVRQSILPDINSSTIEIINEDLRIKNELLLGAYSIGEVEYLKTLSTWLTYQKEYFRDIKEYLSTPKFQSSEQRENLLLVGMAKYGFYELPRIKQLTPAGIREMEELLVNNHIPYQVAMLHYIGFIEHLNQHFDAKYKVNKELSKWLGGDKEGRTVKANIATLNPKSNEDRARYTAHLHKETVKKDYQRLK